MAEQDINLTQAIIEAYELDESTLNGFKENPDSVKEFFCLFGLLAFPQIRANLPVLPLRAGLPFPFP